MRRGNKGGGLMKVSLTSMLLILNILKSKKKLAPVGLVSPCHARKNLTLEH